MTFEAALRLFTRRLLARASKGSLEAFLRQLPRHEPALAELLRRAILRSYLQSARSTARQLELPTALAAGDAPPFDRPPWESIDAGGAGDLPVRFPGIRAAADWLSRRRLLLPEDFEALDDQARRTAFTVARSATVDAVERVRSAVVEDVRDGGTLGEFREKVRGVLDKSMLAPNRIETLYRTHAGQAMAAGQRAVLDHPLVGDEFPYLLFTATHDERTRASHMELETWGQNGTAVYRRDDPIWDVLWPPMEWNCRCNVIPLSIEDAARYGSREARRWLQSGEAPANPEYARRPYPVQPPAGWPDHRGVAAVV